ncbi:MAG TPA: NFACT RNA binding domain-containing protein [Candidatus Rubrimentiphilum sp.]|nr:NFACT RNA binding domain-containing protein [Candidatus Rubrimentiphilum sp.]
MYSDWILIARLAHEIEERFLGARVRDVGQLPDGRFALALWRKGSTQLLTADVFAATPVLTVENGELPIAAEPGFVRAAGAALRGKTLTAVRAFQGERILQLEFAAQSRFGVPEVYALICELVPRFGNLILIKDATVVSALKEFKRSAKTLRTVRPGARYEPPPARPGKSRFAIEPLPSQESVRTNDLYVYRDEHGALQQAHVVPLEQYTSSRLERAPSLLEIFAELRCTGTDAHVAAGTADKRRADAERALADRERKLRTELARIEERLAETTERNDLRARGQAIYSKLHELPEKDKNAAKLEATDLFSRYKKAAVAGDHLTRRRTGVLQSLEEVEELRWELERAGDDELREIAELLKPRQRRAASPKARPAKKRRVLAHETPHGSRILVGRSPLENAELTFRVARPDDLWFHARGQPGAHVILQRDDRRDAPEEDVLTAAQLAAAHSKGRNSAKVTVDYTPRKHVRKRPNAAPGLVFYTNAKSLLVEPRDLR